MPRSRAAASRLSRSGLGMGMPFCMRSSRLMMALLAGQPDAIDPGQPLGAAHGADRRIDMALELRRRRERLDRNSDDGVAGIGGLALLLHVIDHLASEGRAVEHAGEQPDDQAQAVTLVVADRQQHAFVGAPGIGERLAVASDHPADRHLLAALGLETHLAEGGDRRRHVQHDGRLLTGGNRDGERIGAEQVLDRAPGRQMVVAADREIEPDHVVGERHHRVGSGRARMVAHARADPGDAVVLRLLDRGHGGETHHQMADAVVAIDQRGRRPLPHDADIRTRIDPARLQAPRIDRQADHAVGIRAAQIGLDHQAGEDIGVVGRQAGGLEGALDERHQDCSRDARHVACTRRFCFGRDLSRHFHPVSRYPDRRTITISRRAWHRPRGRA